MFGFGRPSNRSASKYRLSSYGQSPRFFFLYGVYLNINRQVCGYAYSNRNYKAHLVEFRADAAIDHVGQGSTIERAHVILVLKALDLGARHTVRHRLVPYVNRVIYFLDRLRGVAHGERVHFRAQANKLDYRIPFGLVSK